PHRYAQELDYLTGDRMAELGIPILHWKTKGTIHISLIPESGWPHPILGTGEWVAPSNPLVSESGWPHPVGQEGDRASSVAANPAMIVVATVVSRRVRNSR